MPVTVFEKRASRRSKRSSSSSDEVGYLIFGTQDETEAGAALRGAVPPIRNGLVIDAVSVDIVSDADGLGGIWEGTVSYITPEKKEQKDQQNQQQQAGDEPVFTVDISGGTAHINVSKETVHSQAAIGHGTAPDHQKAIGATEDGNVEGCDIPEVAFSWTEQHFLPPATVNSAYIRKLRRLYAKTNAATFRGEPPHTVRFDGANGSKRGSKDWDFTFRFASGETESITNSAFANPIPKKPHEYIWFAFTKSDDAAAKVLRPVPRAVYVERVLDPGDFAELGIGTDELVL